MGIFSTVYPTSPYPQTYEGMPQDQDDWSCDHWKIYYQNNKAIMGQSSAVKLVENDSNNVGWFANSGSCRYNCEFVNYMRKEGFTIDSFISDIYCETTETATNILKTTNVVSKLILPIGLVAAIIFISDKRAAKK